MCWKDYVVLDDRSLLGEAGGEFMEGHFVQTRLVKGLTEAPHTPHTSTFTRSPAIECCTALAL